MLAKSTYLKDIEGYSLCSLLLIVDLCIYIHFFLIELNLAFIYSLCCNGKVMPVDKDLPLLWLDGEA